MKQRILICYEYFYPGYKAGGPIQSLSNLVSTFCNSYEISVLTGVYDLNTSEPYKDVKKNAWSRVYMPDGRCSVNIYYADNKRFNRSSFKSVLNAVTPHTVYLNGIFSYRFFQLPLLTLKGYKSCLEIIICPRGMLKKGALQNKAFKKSIYLFLLKRSQLLNHVRWHATNKDEAAEIARHFPFNNNIFIAPNIPKIPYKDIAIDCKEPGQLKLVYLALINRHKNLYQLLRMLKNSRSNISLDIYGPITDTKYWSECLSLIDERRKCIQYKGEVKPVQVQEIISQYHALILLTKGENFGHALYESLSVGRPIITSHYTPWKTLQQKKAGMNVSITDFEDCLKRIEDFANMGQKEYNIYCQGAHDLAWNYYNNLEPEEKYKKLFNNDYYLQSLQ